MMLELWRSSSSSLLKGDNDCSDKFGEHNQDKEDETTFLMPKNIPTSTSANNSTTVTDKDFYGSTNSSTMALVDGAKSPLCHMPSNEEG